MSNNQIKTLIITVAALFAFCTHADNLRGFYAGGGGGIVDANVLDANGDGAEFRLLEAFGGYKYASWAGGEIRIGSGLSEDNVIIDDTDFELKIDHFETIYYRPELSNETAKLYGLIGFTNIEMSSNSTRGKESSSESGISYGFGIGFVMNENLNLNFEYRELIDKEDTQFTVIGISFDWRI